MSFYDWQQTLSRNARVYIVCGARSIGKTFGFRLQMLRDALKGYPFAEVCRFANELELVEDGYFDKIQEQGFYTAYEFKVEKHRAFAREAGTDEWQLIGYFCALTQQSSLKKKTFIRPKNILLDEAFLETTDRYHNYLPDEYGKLCNLVSTLVRETEEDPALDTRVVLLGNSVDLVNPYFQNLAIDKVPSFGYQWYNGKTVLLHYVEATDEEVERKKSGTLVGILTSGTSDADMIFANEFAQGSDEFIEDRPANARFMFGVVFQGQRFGVWSSRMVVYVTDRVPNNASPVYALTMSDNRIDYNAASAATPQLRNVREWYYKGRVRYSAPGIRERFANVLKMLGIK